MRRERKQHTACDNTILHAMRPEIRQAERDKQRKTETNRERQRQTERDKQRKTDKTERERDREEDTQEDSEFEAALWPNGSKQRQSCRVKHALERHDDNHEVHTMLSYLSTRPQSIEDRLDFTSCLFDLLYYIRRLWTFETFQRVQQIPVHNFDPACFKPLKLGVLP